jgi:hypothetical protein
MRNTTKLKNVLVRYTVSLDLADDGSFMLMLFDKVTHQSSEFEGKSYSIVITKAYSHLLRKLKEEDESNEVGLHS